MLMIPQWIAVLNVHRNTTSVISYVWPNTAAFIVLIYRHQANHHQANQYTRQIERPSLHSGVLSIHNNSQHI
jgi:hypothetical protein